MGSPHIWGTGDLDRANLSILLERTRSVCFLVEKGFAGSTVPGCGVPGSTVRQALRWPTRSELPKLVKGK